MSSAEEPGRSSRRLCRLVPESLGSNGYLPGGTGLLRVNCPSAVGASPGQKRTLVTLVSRSARGDQRSGDRFATCAFYRPANGDELSRFQWLQAGDDQLAVGPLCSSLPSIS